MNEDEIRKILREELGNIAPEMDLQALDPSADLREALDLDSIDFLNFITAIHHRLGIDVPELDYPKLFTLDGAVSHLASRLKRPRAPQPACKSLTARTLGRKRRPHAQSPLVQSCRLQPLRGACILIAEDDAMLAFDLQDVLRKAGAEILGPAATLANALALARSASLTCAVLDVNLRHELVFPAAQVLKERCVKIIFHTGCGDPEGLRRDWPDAQILKKPAPCGLLIRTVCAACCGLGLGTLQGCRDCS